MSAILAAISPLEEARLIRRAMRGDSSALDSLFARHNRALYQTALRLLGNAEDAEDALQEGLLAAYRNLPRFEGRSQFSTWLTRIVINAALMRLRSKRARPAISLEGMVRRRKTAFRSRSGSPQTTQPRRSLRWARASRIAQGKSRRTLAAPSFGVSTPRRSGSKHL